MRKRILIAALAILVLGVLAYTLSQPKEGSLEWHRRKLAEVERAIRGTNVTFGDRLSYGWQKLWNREFVGYDTAQKHIEALIKLGYIEEREFVLSNRTAYEIRRGGWATGGNFEVLRIYHRETNVVIVIAAKTDMPAVEGLIRQADASETGK